MKNLFLQIQKKKVDEAIIKLNYHPELTARNLRLRKTNTIGVIIPNIADYFFANIVSGSSKIFYGQG